MKYWLRILLIIITAAPAYFYTVAQNRPSSNFEFPQFSTLRVQDNVNVVYHTSPDSLARVSYSGAEEFGNAFIFTHSGNTLKVQVTTEDVGKTDLPTIHIYSRLLEKIENFSNFNVTIENTGASGTFDAAIIGNGTINVLRIDVAHINAKITAGRGTINLQGKCRDATFKLTGAGTINAENLAMENLTCKIFGGGAIYCPDLKNLTVRGIGSTKIHYPGKPRIKHSGGGKLIPD